MICQVVAALAMFYRHYQFLSSNTAEMFSSTDSLAPNSVLFAYYRIAVSIR